MSALRSYDQIGEGGSGASIEVPKSFQPDGDTVLINSDSRLFEYPASVSTFSPSGVSQIIIPQHRSRYILGGTSYLQFRVLIDVNQCIMGPPPANGVTYTPAIYFTGGPTKSAAALIDRITVSASNGQVLADVTNYAQWHNLILCHASNEDYTRNASISECAFTAAVSGTTLSNGPGGSNVVVSFNGTVDVSLPLALNLFQESKAFPLWALNGPLIIVIQWASQLRSLSVAPMPYMNSADLETRDGNLIDCISAVGITYSGSELTYRCRCVDVDTDYIQQQRAMMMAGKVLTYNYRQVQGLIVKPAVTGISFNFGVNCSSLLAVFGATMMDKDCDTRASSVASGAAGTGTWTLGTNPNNKGSWGFSSNSQQNVRVYRDGTQLSTFALNRSGRDDTFIPLMEAFGVLFSTTNSSAAKRCLSQNPILQSVNSVIDTARTYQGPQGAHIVQNFSSPLAFSYGNLDGGSVYAPNTYAWGLSARMCNDAEIINKGSACSQLQITVDSMASAAATTYIFYAYACSISFDASGNVMVRR